MTPTLRRTFGSNGFGSGIRSLGKPAAAYPGAVATDSDLMIAVDRQQTRLALPLNATDTSMTVVDPSLITTYNLLSIDNEIVKTIGPPTGNAIPISRGFDGTTPALHLASALVSGFVDAYHHNRLVAEVEAIQQTLGPNLSRIPASQFVISSQYDFPAQTPGGSLVVGANAIQLTPVPEGVNGSDTGHYVYISSGTGTPEAALIVGGSATAGSPSGTLIIQCANTHSGSWTIGSASAGIAEALVFVSGQGGGTVLVPEATITIRGTVRIPPACCLHGDGASSILVPGAANQTMFNFAPAGYHRGHVSHLQIDASSFSGINSVKAFYGAGVRQIGLDYIWLSNVRWGFYFTNQCWDIDVRTVFAVDNSGFYYGDDTGSAYSWNLSLDGWYTHLSAGIQAMPMITLERAVNAYVAHFISQTLNALATGILVNNDCQGVAVESCTIVAAAIGVDIAWNPVNGITGAGPNWNIYDSLMIDQAQTAAIRMAAGASWNNFSNIIVASLAAGGTGINNPANSIGNLYSSLDIQGNDNTIGFLGDANSRNWSVTNSYFLMSGAAAIGIQINAGANIFRVENTLFEGSGTPISDASGAVQKIIARNQTTTTAAISHVDTFAANETYSVSAKNIVFKAGVSTPSLTTTLANGLNSNIALGSTSYLRINGPSAAFTLGGFTEGADGKILRVYNTSGQAMTIAHESAGSVAANRISTNTNADVVLPAGNSTATFIYDSGFLRWILTARHP
jgi:hypothetical protein